MPHNQEAKLTKSAKFSFYTTHSFFLKVLIELTALGNKTYHQSGGDIAIWGEIRDAFLANAAYSATTIPFPLQEENLLLKIATFLPLHDFAAMTKTCRLFMLLRSAFFVGAPNPYTVFTRENNPYFPSKKIPAQQQRAVPYRFSRKDALTIDHEVFTDDRTNHVLVMILRNWDSKLFFALSDDKMTVKLWRVGMGTQFYKKEGPYLLASDQSIRWQSHGEEFEIQYSATRAKLTVTNLTTKKIHSTLPTATKKNFDTVVSPPIVSPPILQPKTQHFFATCTHCKRVNKNRSIKISEMRPRGWR